MRPLSRTEMKILVYNKTRQGMTYSEACKQVAAEIAHLKATMAKPKKKDEPKNANFKESFAELTGRKK